MPFFPIARYTLHSRAMTDIDRRYYLDFPFVGVGVVVWKNDEFLLIRRGKEPMKGAWSIPGGRQNLGETIKEAAIREIREETGLDIDIIGLIDVIDSIREDDNGVVAWHATLIDYAARHISGEAVAGDDALSVGWFTLEDLQELGLWSETVRIIRKSAQIAGTVTPR